MTSPPDDTTTDTSGIIAALRAERDAGLAREAALAEALATRNSEYGERIAHQAATIDVLKAMSASPGDPQPVFDLIVTRARDLCDGYGATVFEFDGALIHWRAATGFSDDPTVRGAAQAMFPMAPTREWGVGRAILERRVIRIDDLEAEPGLSPALRAGTAKSSVTIPLMRGDVIIGALSLSSRERGGFSDTQIELLKTFAEQAVIAISSAETYRALQTRTSDLQETLEYQTATSDVLKVISRSTFDLQPVLETVVQTATQLCNAEMALIGRRDGERWRVAANFGFPPEYEAYERAHGAMAINPNSPSVGWRAVREQHVVHIHDVAAIPDYHEASIRLAKQRTSLGVPLVRDGEAIGVIMLARRRVEPFTDRQIDLVSTFADQAVIAIENTRLITEQQEALERQTAMAEVLAVINANPGELGPVFDMILEKAHRLCDIGMGALLTCEAGQLRAVVTRGYSPEADAHARRLRPIPDDLAALAKSGAVLHDPDVSKADGPLSGDFGRTFIALTGARTYLVVPLSKEGTLLGTITAVRREVRPFSERQITLLKNFAAQAVIAMENARLITEQREALEQQTATAEVLGVINASPGDLTPVFDAILEKAHRLCGATHGSLTLFDGEIFRAVATYGHSEVWTERLRKGLPAVNNPGTEPLLDGARFVHIADIVDINHPLTRAAAEATGVRTALFVPLRKDNRLIGAISAHRREVRPFTEKEIALLENFAAQAVIAMENARLLTETREALQQQTATAEVLGVINSSPGDLAPVFDAMLEKAHGLCGIAMGSLELYDGQRFRAVAVRGLSDAFADMLRRGYPASENPATGPLIDGGRLTHIRDLTETDYAITRSGLELDAARTLLCVPLRREGTLLGMIASSRKEVRPFSDKEIALLENFAAQAVIAMENARLLTEQREALEQQTATAEVLQVINASPGNLAPVFDAMLQKAMRLCEAAFGSLYTYDGESFHSAAQRGVPAAYSALRERTPPSGQSGGPATRILQTKRTVHILDIMSEEAYQAGHTGIRALVELGGARTILGVPLLKDNTILGYISIYRQEVRAFTDKQIALLENFAAQAVVAMENARLITEQREALEQQTATAEVLQVINASPGNLVPVFDAMLQRATRLCGTAIGSFWSYNGEAFQVLASTIGDTGRTMQPDPGTRLWRIAHGESVVQIADVETEPAYRVDAVGQMRTRLAGTRTALAVALRKDETLVGAILTGRLEVRPFTDKQIALLQNFAAQAVIAMENARLLAEQKEALEQQTATAEVLQVINASPGDLAPVFDAILEKAHDLCGAAIGALVLYDGEYFRGVATHGFPEEHAELVRQPHAASASFFSALVHGERLVHIHDLRTAVSRRHDALSRSHLETAKTRTALLVPLRKDDRLLGFISAYRLEVRPFLEKEIALLENFAAQAVIAMENARLLDELRARTDELAQRQAELRVTFENMGDGVAMFDEAQHLVAWNRKFQDILDVPDDIIARRQTFSEYVRYLAERGEYDPEADPEEHVRRLIEQAGQSRTYERTRPDGRVIEIRHNPVPGGGFVLIYADITERKRNEAEIRAARDAAEEASRTIEAAYRELKTAQANLIQAEKMASLGQLTAGIAHEIKNPLNFVNNFAALSVDLLGELKETAAPGFAALTEKQRAEVEEVSAMLTSNLEKITEHGKRADGIVKAMLEHSRGSSGERRMVDLNMLIDEALNLAYHGARAQDQSFNITLERDFGEDIAAIEVNPQDMTRVFLNLFANGFYATTRRARGGGDAGFVPTLKVTTRDAGEAVEIHVRDNGIGIPADIRDKLFQPFFTTKPTGEGTGLGLSITYDIVTQQHGGSIAVDSLVGDYSEFTIRLPRKP